MQLILASASPRRKALLTALGVPYTVHLPTCDERTYPGDPIATVSENARRKALSVQVRYPNGTILAADTAVSFQGRVLGKPRSPEEAQAWLLDYAGKLQQVFTAVAFAIPGKREPELFIEATSLRFKDYGLAVVQEYIDRVQPFDRAGAYDINAYGDQLIEARFGSYSNVMGLPQSLVANWLAAHAFAPGTRGEL